MVTAASTNAIRTALSAIAGDAGLLGTGAPQQHQVARQRNTQSATSSEWAGSAGLVTKDCGGCSSPVS